MRKRHQNPQDIRIVRSETIPVSRHPGRCWWRWCWVSSGMCALPIADLCGPPEPAGSYPFGHASDARRTGPIRRNLPTRSTPVDPAAAKSLLQRAVSSIAMTRPAGSSWGSYPRLANDLPGAEKALLRAASVDATFLPSWSLANFYFRQENACPFLVLGAKSRPDGSGRRDALVPPGLVRQAQMRQEIAKPAANQRPADRRPVRKFSNRSRRSEGGDGGGIAVAR